MTFKPSSILHDSLCYYEANDKSGKDLETGIDLPFLVSLVFHQVKISRMKGCLGRYDPKEQIIYIHPKYTTDKTVILHEMIHGYECILLQKGVFGQILRDTLTFCLYNSLKPKIKDLDIRVLDHSHVIRQQNLINDGGSHGILFFLKSLDLDIRLGLKPGTICGYGRDEFPGNTGEEMP
jgi:hypothetical protein